MLLDQLRSFLPFVRVRVTTGAVGTTASDAEATALGSALSGLAQRRWCLAE